MVLLDDLITKKTTTTKIKNGYICKCTKGLWTVYAPTKKEAEFEGYKYWVQYFKDGEYNERLKNE
jgi:hypothetical protein